MNDNHSLQVTGLIGHRANGVWNSAVTGEFVVEAETVASVSDLGHAAVVLDPLRF